MITNFSFLSLSQQFVFVFFFWFFVFSLSVWFKVCHQKYTFPGWKNPDSNRVNFFGFTHTLLLQLGFSKLCSLYVCVCVLYVVWLVGLLVAFIFDAVDGHEKGCVPRVWLKQIAFSFCTLNIKRSLSLLLLAFVSEFP